MKRWLRRIRGAIGMAVTWAFGWSVVGSILWRVGEWFFPAAGPTDAMLSLFIAFGGIGFIGGATFSIVLGIAEGRRRFDQMSVPRFAILGAAAGLGLSLIALSVQAPIRDTMFLATLLPLLGAGSASGALVLARRVDDEMLLDSGADATEIGGATRGGGESATVRSDERWLVRPKER
jgi:multisubunit Na+/H+ antiporter MnhB subunit